MEYLYSKNRKTYKELHDELRVNFIRINNTFCENYHSMNLKMLDLFKMFQTSNIELDRMLLPIVRLATRSEGLEEAAYKSGEDDEWRKREYEDIIEALKEAMAKLPPN